MNIQGIITIITSFISVIGCSQFGTVQFSLSSAGDNRAELESVLEYYSKEDKDPLKLQAAEYLIANMPLHRSYSGGIEAYYDAIDSIIPTIKDKTIFKDRMAELYSKYEPSFSLCYDVKTIKAAFLISSIDNAFRMWREGKWAKHLGFNDFKDCLLPYSCIDSQPFSNWAISLMDTCRGAIDTMEKECREYESNPSIATEEVVAHLKGGFLKYSKQLDLYPIFRATTLKNLPYGTCIESCISAVQILRSKGLPVFIDFIPQWANRRYGHYWLSVLNLRQGVEAFSPFGIEDEDSTHKNRPLPKVYRMTYSPNKELVKRVMKKEYVPSSLSYIYFKDVSDEYMITDDVTVPTFKRVKIGNDVYVATFNNQEWVAVACGKKVWGRKVSFRKLGRNVLYLPIQYDKNGVMEPIGEPFYLDLKGEIEPFHNGGSVSVNVGMTRKYPVYQFVYVNKAKIRGGVIQTSDTKDFKKVKTVAEFPKIGLNLAGLQKINSDIKSRYWRFASSDNGRSDMAELIFYDRAGARLSPDLILCGREVHPDNKVNLATAINDDDPLTFFSARGEDDIWVGFDFGDKVSIGFVNYFRRSDGNNFYPDRSYTLYYWDNKSWRKLRTFIADRTLVVKARVPAYTLLWINGETSGTESRPFVVDSSGRIQWY